MTEHASLAKRQLGKTGLQVTQIGYGSMGLRGPRTWGVRVVDESDAEAFLHRVLDVGINFIDTAPDYGIAEERIGRYLHGRRDEFYLATKCGCVYTQHEDHLEIDHVWKPDIVKDNLDTSLKRLRTDHVDLMQFHGGDAKTLQRSGLIDLLVDLKRQGVLRHLGVSSKLPNLLELIDLDVFETFQVPYSVLAPENDQAMRAAHDRGAGIIIRGGIAHGGPDAEIKRPHLDQVWQAARLDELVPDDCSRAQFLLRATLSHPACDTTIVGTCNPNHLAENLDALHAGPLPAATLQELQQRVKSHSSL